MATVTVLLNDRYKSKDDTFPIILKVEHQGQRRKIAIGYRVTKAAWNEKERQVKGKHPDAILINAAISEKEREAKRYLADCKLHGKPVRLDLIGTGRASYSFTEYLDRRAAQYKAAGKIVMDRKVRRFALEMRTAFGSEIYFEDVNLDWLRRLEQHQIDNGNVENTRHKKFKFLCEFYQHAISEGKAAAPNPFKSYKIVTKPVKKNKLSADQIKAIEELQLAPGPVNDARNIFLFSFYAKGQRFEVCATLQRRQVGEGRIQFRTNKGNEHLSVKIHARLQSILDQYSSGDFIFPYIKELPTDPTRYLSAVASANTMVNKNLKIVGQLAKLKIPLTMHIARHSFAYQLKGVTDNVNIIQDALGHSDQKITQVYLKALQDDVLDKEMEKLYGL